MSLSTSMVSKRALSAQNTVVIMVLFLAFTVFMMVFIKSGVSRTSDETVSRENCAATVERMDQFNRFNVPVGDRGLDCPPVSLTVKEKSDEKNNEKIAQAMYTCAKQFKRGQAELFRSDGVHCNICSIVHIETEEPVRGFYTYLFENTIPEENGQTYFEYFQGYKSKEAQNVLNELKTSQEVFDINNPEETATLVPAEAMAEIGLEPGEQYATIFIYARGQDHFEKVYRHLTAQTDAGKAALALGGITFLGVGAATAGGVAATSAASFAVTGTLMVTPAGWFIIASGAVITAATVGAIEKFTYHFSPDNHPEYASFFVFRGWNKDDAQAVLEGELQCDFFS